MFLLENGMYVLLLGAVMILWQLMILLEIDRNIKILLLFLTVYMIYVKARFYGDGLRFTWCSPELHVKLAGLTTHSKNRVTWLKGEVRENLGDFRKSIQILTFLSPLPHVPLLFTKRTCCTMILKRMQLTSLE